MKKKLYKSPSIRSIDIDNTEIICESMNIYDVEAPFAGAKRRGSYVDFSDCLFDEDYEDEE